MNKTETKNQYIKKYEILDQDIDSKINYEKSRIIRPDKNKNLSKIQLFFTLAMGIVVLIGIVYTLLSQLK